MRRRLACDRFTRFLSLAATAAVLAAGGCSRLATQDGGPAYSGDFSTLPDPVPHYEPPSQYGNPDSYVVAGKRYHVLASSKGYVARGIASWYGTKFHGQRTSSGEIYDMYAMTAAHRTLPLPTYARVTNLRNRRSVIVRINDRGPFHSNRLIDLSYAAASKLGIVEKGTGLVQVEAIDPLAPKHPAPTLARAKTKAGENRHAGAETDSVEKGGEPTKGSKVDLYIQVAAFLSETNAEHLRRKLQSKHIASVTIQKGASGDHLIYRVRIGPLPSVGAADALAARLAGLGIEDPQVIVD